MLIARTLVPIQRRTPSCVRTHLQHVQESSLAGIIKTEEKKLGVLVQKTKRGQNIVDCNQHNRLVNPNSDVRRPSPEAKITSQGPRHSDCMIRSPNPSGSITRYTLSASGAESWLHSSSPCCLPHAVPVGGLGLGSGVGALTPVDDPHGAGTKRA